MKSKEQAAIDYHKCNPKNSNKLAFLAGVAFAEQWISLEDELPEIVKNNNSDFVLLLFEDHFTIGSLNNNGYGWRDFWGNPIIYEILGWRPINRK